MEYRVWEHRLSRIDRYGLIFATLLLSGCASGHIASNANTADDTFTKDSMGIHGSVMGGQQPVQGSSIQLYSVGTSGTASSATPLLTSNVVSDSNGSFNITGKYNCTGATEVYITASGGNPGYGTNSAIGLIAALGPCSSLASTNLVEINELTTVAAVFSLSPFMSDVAHVGVSSSNIAGLNNAFATAAMLVNASSGGVATAPAGMTLPGAAMDTLANILASCINSSSPTSYTCQQLLSATGASDTLSAALSIAKNPGTSVSTLWSLASGQPVFLPALSTQPNDFTLAAKYNGIELSTPFGIAMDSSGNAWVTNESGSSIVKMPPLSPTFATSPYSGIGLLAPRGVAISCYGTIWVANTGGNNVVALNSNGSNVTWTSYTGGGINSPTGIAIDAYSNAWVTNFTGNSVTRITPVGVTTNINGGGVLDAPTSVAFDPYGKAVVANSGSGDLCVFSATGTLQSCINDGQIFGPTAIAVSSIGTVSMAGSTTGASVSGAFTLASSGGAVVTGSPVSGTGGLTLPTAVAYDSGGNAWFTNTSSLSEFAGVIALSPTSGYGSLVSPQSIAIDQSGNVWTANAGDNSISIFIGLAASTNATSCAGGGVD